jgi:GTP-binding protein LepA
MIVCFVLCYVQEKQKEGKKRMKRVGNVELSQEAFLSVIGGGSGGGK